MHLKVDTEFRDLIPGLATGEYEALEASIRSEGCRDALVVCDGVILDGHNRYEICLRHGIQFDTTERQFASRDEAKEWIARNQLARRNLNAWCRCRLALTLEPPLAARAKEHQRLSPGRGRKGSQICDNPIDTKKELAKIAGVSHFTIAKAKKILAVATEGQKEQLRKGNASISQVYEQIKAQERKVDKMDKMKKAEQATVTPLNSLGKFSVIYADPPWRYEHGTPGRQEIENIYPTMPLEEIKSLPIDQISMSRCVLFLWSPNPKVDEALEVIESWGFKYRTNFAWVKDRIGQGYYARQKHEMLMIAVRGDMHTPDPENRFSSVIESPRRAHSQKPEKVYAMIEAMYPGLRKVELFARDEHPGWVSWGDEVKAEGEADV